MTVHALDEIMHLQLAEAAAEGDVLLRSEALAAKENHAVLDQRLADFAEYAVVEFLRQVDAGDLGAERPRNRVNLDRAVGHGRLLRRVRIVGV